MKNNDIIEMAAELAARLSEDIRLASTRIEHVRVTARANEAVNLLHALQTLTDTEAEADDISNSDG